MESPQQHNIFAKLRWACRRGMLELDVLLGNFLNDRYAMLTDTDKIYFAELLNMPDPELFAWLMGHEIPSKSEWIHLIKMTVLFP